VAFELLTGDADYGDRGAYKGLCFLTLPPPQVEEHGDHTLWEATNDS